MKIIFVFILLFFTYPIFSNQDNFHNLKIFTDRKIEGKIKVYEIYNYSYNKEFDYDGDVLIINDLKSGSYKISFNSFDYLSQKNIKINDFEDETTISLKLIEKEIIKKEAKKYKIRDSVLNGIYLAGAIFPITNLLFSPYYGNEFARSFLAYYGIGYFIFGGSSIFSTISEVFLPLGIYNYYNKNINIDSNTFIAIGACFISISYLINLIYGIASFIFQNLNSNDKKYEEEALYHISLSFNNKNIEASLSFKY